jgi:hypothetical protein
LQICNIMIWSDQFSVPNFGTNIKTFLVHCYNFTILMLLGININEVVFVLHFRYCNYMSRCTIFESLFWAEYVYRSSAPLAEIGREYSYRHFILPNHVIWYCQLIVYKNCSNVGLQACSFGRHDECNVHL